MINNRIDNMLLYKQLVSYNFLNYDNYLKTRVEKNIFLIKQSKFTLLNNEIENIRITSELPIKYNSKKIELKKMLNFVKESWRKCKNGHYYVIEDLQDPIKKYKCPDCDDSVIIYQKMY